MLWAPKFRKLAKYMHMVSISLPTGYGFGILINSSMPHHSTFITNTDPASLMRCYSKKISHVVIVRAVVLGANFQYDLVFACIYVKINGIVII